MATTNLIRKTPSVVGHIISLLPQKEGFPAISDWQVIESFIKQKMEDEEQAQRDLVWHMAPGPRGGAPGSGGLYRTTIRKDSRANYETGHNCAVFRRS